MSALAGRHEAILDALPGAVAVMRASDLAIVYANRRFLRLADSSSELIRTKVSRLDDVELGPLWVIAAEDVSGERDEDLRAWGESQRRFDALWDSGMIGLAISDAGARIVEANATYLRMLGYSRRELEAGTLRFTDLLPASGSGELAETTQRVANQGYAEPWETETTRKDGSRLPVMVGVTMLDEHHNLAMVADLSMRRRAEETLRRTEEQLRHAQKMEAVGRLAGGVAHDFNNLLSIIIAYPGMLMDELGAQHPMHGDLAEIMRAGQRAAELTRRLLLFSRQQVVEPRVVDLNQLLQGMHRMVQRLIGEDVELVAALGLDVGQVLVDPGNLEQVIMNLAVNSRDAMPDGGRLTIETASVVLDDGDAAIGIEPGRYALLAITDTGCGMDAATQGRIFEPFFTTKGVGKGTGLGLSMVFGIVQQSRGHIRVDSEVGRGTTFRIYLPRVDAEIAVPAPIASIVRLRGTETVLLAEDDDQVRAVARTILRHYGYHVIEARNAGEALLACEQHPGTIDLLVSDVVMPGMNGPTLAVRLRRTRPSMRVLCVSGYTDDHLVSQAIADGAIAFLQKPLIPEILARKVREILDTPSP